MVMICDPRSVARCELPGADDDMSGMSIQLETARLLVQHKAQIANTVRFVASDDVREDRHGLPDLDRAPGDHVPGRPRRRPEVTAVRFLLPTCRSSCE
jgi:hypothetical protein